jgi:hypothetical protein
VALGNCHFQQLCLCFACSFSVLSNLLEESFSDDILHTTHQTAIPTFFTIAEFKWPFDWP